VLALARRSMIGGTLILHSGTALIVYLATQPAKGAFLLLALAFVHPGLLPPILTVGELSFRLFDVVYAMLLVALLGSAAVGRHLKLNPEARSLARIWTPLGCYILCSLAVVAVLSPAYLSVSSASFLRLVLTASLAFVIPVCLRNPDDLRAFQTGFVLFTLAIVVVGVVQLFNKVSTNGAIGLMFRYDSLVGVAALGLISGLIVVLALLRRDDPLQRKGWQFLLAAGLVGLFLAKTVSSLFALVAIFPIWLAMRTRFDVANLLKVAALTFLVLGLAGYALITWRGRDIQALLLGSGGSFAQRILLYYAGWQLFTEHLFFGIGWMASTSPEYLGSSELNAHLLRLFPRLPAEYLPMFKQTSVHNMYLQMLVELGIVGFMLFAWTLIRSAAVGIRMLRSVPIESPFLVWARFYFVGILYLLIWWNTTPLYGGQTESLLAFVFAGSLSATMTVAGAQPKAGRAISLAQ
jgi:O-antigen ligase